MSRRPVTVALVSTAVLTATLLSGCGTGLQNQTYQETGRQDTTHADAGTLAIRNVFIEPPASGNALPKGGTAVLHGDFVNKSDTEDALVGVRTDIAAAAELQLDGQPATSIVIPARGVSDAKATVLLKDLTRDVKVGEYVTVTFTFKRAGATELQVPVHAGDTGLGTREPAQDPYHKPE